MRRIESILDPILDAVDVQGKTVIDVGCGTGDVARWLSAQGATVIGVDKPDMVEKARHAGTPANVTFSAGAGEDIPAEDGIVDIVLFLASFHHVPVEEMPKAREETYRVLRSGGHAIFIEPIIECSYYLITSLAEDVGKIERHVGVMAQAMGRMGETIERGGETMQRWNPMDMMLPRQQEGR